MTGRELEQHPLVAGATALPGISHASLRGTGSCQDPDSCREVHRRAELLVIIRSAIHANRESRRSR